MKMKPNVKVSNRSLQCLLQAYGLPRVKVYCWWYVYTPWCWRTGIVLRQYSTNYHMSISDITLFSRTALMTALINNIATATADFTVLRVYMHKLNW